MLAVAENLPEATGFVKRLGVRYEGLSYIGGFPTFTDTKGKTYSVQGSVRVGDRDVVCSLPQKEAEGFALV